MDELDVNLLEAWGRVVGALRGNPAAARRRWRRSRGASLRRLPRAWCLGLRASDTRIHSWNAYMSDPLAVGYRARHRVELDGRAIRALCAPVTLKWPGVGLVEAAARLGRHPEAVRHWLPARARPGRSRQVRAHQSPRRYEEIIEPGGFLFVSYEKAQCHGHRGMDVPVVWSDRPLDPGASRGRAPHALWGTMWRHLRERVPDDYVLSVDRLPRVRPYGDREARFRGWDFRCPGRFDVATGTHRACGRRVQTLYLPLPVFTIAHWLGDEGGIEVGEVRDEDKSAKPQAAKACGGCSEEKFRGRLSGRWYPGLEDAWDGRRSFACGHCWNVRGFSICDYRGWNDFVSYISGGLLFGREVKQPAWLRYERKLLRRQAVKRGNSCRNEIARQTPAPSCPRAKHAPRPGPRPLPLAPPKPLPATATHAI